MVKTPDGATKISKIKKNVATIKGVGMETITIKDIARIAGVGVSTVSRALNNHPDINPDTRNHIMEVVDKYGFVPNTSARNLKITESKTIAILVKGMTNPFFVKMIGVMEEEIQEKHYSMELRHLEENMDGVEVALELVKEKKLCGIIFLGGLATLHPEKLEALGVPFVLSTVSEEAEDLNYSSVCVDDVGESYKMVNYLIGMGHRRIAIMAAPKSDDSIGNLRMQGYLKALKDNGITVDEGLIWHAKEDTDTYSMENGYNVMKEQLAQNRDFTAVFAISDTMAIGAIRALHEAGIKIPDEISIAGFDGINMGKYCIPSLTTVVQPFSRMARKTTELLFDVIRKGGEHRKVTMEASILERESVAKIP